MSEAAGVAAIRTRHEDLAIAVALGFFSFGKFLMYRDLDPATWPPGARLALAA